jgi:hypothetical protein
MPEQLHLFDGLSTRDGFNKSLKHFKFIMGVIAEFEGNRNLAEILSDHLVDKSIEPTQVLPTLNAILVDKYGYHFRSHNLMENFEDFDALSAEVSKWRAMDIVVAYFHPELGIVAVNPKNRSHWDGVQSLKRNELVTVFAGAFKGTGSEAIYDDGISTFISLVEGTKVKTPASFTRGKFVQKRARPVAAAPAAPARARGRPRRDYPAAAASVAYPAAAAASVVAAPAAPAAPALPVQSSTASKKMTPMYGIPVTNELFHNGNVEAWKKIIQSYVGKYSGLDVYVFYEGERIHDINTLFKWGKVKHGSSIMISVAGDDIKDVAKLQRYLKQGASHMFEAFLKAPVNTVLNLF